MCSDLLVLRKERCISFNVFSRQLYVICLTGRHLMTVLSLLAQDINTVVVDTGWNSSSSDENVPYYFSTTVRKQHTVCSKEWCTLHYNTS